MGTSDEIVRLLTKQDNKSLQLLVGDYFTLREGTETAYADGSAVRVRCPFLQLDGENAQITYWKETGTLEIHLTRGNSLTLLSSPIWVADFLTEVGYTDLNMSRSKGSTIKDTEALGLPEDGKLVPVAKEDFEIFVTKLRGAIQHIERNLLSALEKTRSNIASLFSDAAAQDILRTGGFGERRR